MNSLALNHSIVLHQAFYIIYTTDALHYAWLYENETLPSSGAGFTDGYGSAFINTLLSRCAISHFWRSYPAILITALYDVYFGFRPAQFCNRPAVTRL